MSRSPANTSSVFMFILWQTFKIFLLSNLTIICNTSVVLTSSRWTYDFMHNTSFFSDLTQQLQKSFYSGRICQRHKSSEFRQLQKIQLMVNCSQTHKCSLQVSMGTSLASWTLHWSYHACDKGKNLTIMCLHSKHKP